MACAIFRVMEKEDPFSGAYRYILIITAGALSYINALSNTFAWDDVYLVVKNPYIKGWSNLPHLFMSGYWESIGETGGLYRPLAMLSFLVEHSVAGLNPLIYHLDNVLLHLACSIAAYHVLKCILPDRSAPVFGALLFAVHPVHSEAVAWVSGRAELLSALFFMLAFLSFIRPMKSIPWRIAAPGLYLLGILSKETAVTLPLFILAYLFFIRKERSLTALARSIAPFAVVFALYLPVRLAVLGGHAGPQSRMFETVKTYYVVLTMLKAGFHYVRLALFPTDLQVAYIFPPPQSFFDPAVLAFTAIIAASLPVSHRLAGKRPALFYLGLWFLIALIPVSNIIPTEVIMTERAMYLPTVGACGLLGVMFTSGVRMLPRPAGHTLLVAALACMCLITINRNGVWKGQASINAELAVINERLVKDFPGHPKAHVKLGESYLAQGRLADAAPRFEEAIRLDPNDADAHFGLAAVYRAAGRKEDALAELKNAVTLGYRVPDVAYVNMAAILYEMGRPKETEGYLIKALETNPQNAMAHLNRGYLLLDRGFAADALADFKEAGRLDPELFESFFQQGLVLGGMGDFKEAADALETAASLRPEDPSVRLYLGAAYEAMGELGVARAQYEEALRIDPDFSPAIKRIEALAGN